MKLIAGLGNPGPKYKHTRHNVGFLVVDELARRWKLPEPRFDRDFQGLLWDAARPADRVLLLAPQTFMNLSGQSVAAVLRFYKLAASDVLIVLDDMDLPTGRIRLRAGGSGGGHNGLCDVLARVGTADVPRLRVGIGRGRRDEAVDHVLGVIAPHEREDVGRALSVAADAAECWIAEGMAAAMNRFNRSEDSNARRNDGPKAPPPQGENA